MQVVCYVWCGSASAARLEDRVDLAAVLHHFPDTAEAGRHHERIAGTEAGTLAALVLDHHAPGGHDAQLVLGIAHAPFAARRRPAAGEELLARVAEVVAHLQLRRPRQ